MNKNDLQLMKEYGITSVNKTVYSYKEHHYDRLKDALNFAAVDRNSRPKQGPTMPENIKLFREKLV